MSVSFDPSMYMSVAFKKLVGVKRWRCVVKFTEPSTCRVVNFEDALDFSDKEKLPDGFCFDCLVDVSVKEGATYGDIAKLFEERCPGRRFIALTWVQEYNLKGFKEFLQARAELPEKVVDHCVILESPAIVADGWWEMSGLSPPVNRWLQKPKPSLLSDIRTAGKQRLAKSNPNYDDEPPEASDSACVAVPTTASIAEAGTADAVKAKWYDGVGPDKPGLSAMVNFGCVHVAVHDHQSTFLRFGYAKLDYNSYDHYRKAYKQEHIFEYPVDVQQRAQQCSSLMPVLVYLRRSVKGAERDDVFSVLSVSRL
jgi:hypothetical protein